MSNCENKYSVDTSLFACCNSAEYLISVTTKKGTTNVKVCRSCNRDITVKYAEAISTPLYGLAKNGEL